MKNLAFKFFAFAVALNSINLQAEEVKAPVYVECEEDVKIYVLPGSIYIAPENIYFNSNGTLLPVKCVSIDENGIYVVLRGLAICVLCGRTYDRRKGHDCPAR